METNTQATQQSWLIMECGRKLYAHVIGLETFTVQKKVNKPSQEQPKE
jgi:hypothetical protein